MLRKEASSILRYMLNDKKHENIPKYGQSKIPHHHPNRNSVLQIHGNAAPRPKRKYGRYSLGDLPRRLNDQDAGLDVVADHGLTHRTEALVNLARGDITSVVPAASVTSSQHHKVTCVLRR